MSPKEPPFLQVQYGPSGPSVTYGMRSFMEADAFAVNRSGGIQGRSMWQSAEIRVWRMDCPSTMRPRAQPRRRPVVTRRIGAHTITVPGDGNTPSALRALRDVAVRRGAPSRVRSCRHGLRTQG